MKRIILLLTVVLMLFFVSCAGDPDARFQKNIQRVDDEFHTLLRAAENRSDRNRIQTRYRENLDEVLSKARPNRLSDSSRVAYAGILLKLERAGEAVDLLRPLSQASDRGLRVAALSELIRAEAMLGNPDVVRTHLASLEAATDRKLDDHVLLLLEVGNALRDKDLELSLELIGRGLTYRVPPDADEALNTAIHIRFVDGGLGDTERGVFLERMRRIYGDRQEIRRQIEKKQAFLDFLGSPAPELDLPGTWMNRGEPLRLSDLRGRYVLIDFFAPWCPDCRNSLPGFLQLGREAGSDRLALVMVTRLYGFYADKETPAARNLEPKREMELLDGYLKRSGLTLPVFVASDEETHKRFSASAIPHYVLIGPDGTVADLCMERVHGFFRRVEEQVSRQD